MYATVMMAEKAFEIVLELHTIATILIVAYTASCRMKIYTYVVSNTVYLKVNSFRPCFGAHLLGNILSYLNSFK